MNLIIIGSRIKALLIIHDMKRSYLAEQLGISYNTLTKKLNAEREFTLAELLEIKEVFNLDVNLCANIFFNPNFLIDMEKH